MTNSHLYCREIMSYPPVTAWEWRVVDGYVYMTTVDAKPEEIPQREKVFREKMAPWIEDPLREYNKRISEIEELSNRLKAFDVEKASKLEFLEHFEDFLAADIRQWNIHMQLLLVFGNSFGMFIDMCRELLGMSPSDPVFQKLMGGFDSMLFRLNREEWRLGNRAVELGLGELFQTTEDNEKVMSKLEESDAGRKWLEEYQEFLKVYGWRCERIQDWATPSWFEKPSLGITGIKLAIAKMAKGGVYTIDQERERLAKEREKAEKEILAKVPAGQKEWFEKLMRVAERAGFQSEDHTFYHDLPFHALGRRVTIEFGRRFAQAGMIDDPEDVYFLMPWEIRKGARAIESSIDLRPYIETRKKEWEGYLSIEPVPFYGDMAAMGDLLRKEYMVGVLASMPDVRPELKANLYGGASAPGEAEGIARVVLTLDRIGEVQPNEILVTVNTTPAWTPAMAIASGVVVDAGGSLAHAVIVAREIGIPCVAGTLEATTKIKTGQRIRVDGNLGAVWILK